MNRLPPLLLMLLMFYPGNAEEAAAPTSVPLSTTSAPLSASVASKPPEPSPASQASCSANPASNKLAACGLSEGGLLLQLDGAAYRLANGKLGQAYQQSLRAYGGQQPYRFSLEVGQLPPGIALGPSGQLSGQANKSGHWSFHARLTDAKGQSVLQGYSLNIVAPSSPRKPTPPPQAKPNLSTLTLEEAQTPPQQQLLVYSYRLLPKVLDEIKPDEPPELAEEPEDEEASATAAALAKLPAGAPPVLLDQAGVDQLKKMLQPLVNIEYPSRALFEAALDAQLCRYSSAMILHSARKHHQSPPSTAQMQQNCPPDWAKLAKQEAPPQAATLRWQDLPASLLSAELRNWLVEQAAQAHPLTLSQPIQWTGGGCGCVLEQLSWPIYGFYPNWWAQGKPQQLPFNLLSRISVFALPFDEEGNLPPLNLTQAKQADFIRQAQHHGSQIDLTLYRNDWQFLQSMPLERQQRAVQQLAKQARQLIDRRLQDPQSKLHQLVPFFAETAHVANGLTLYLDQLPPAHSRQWPAFAHYFKQLMHAMISQLRQGERHYTLNVVIPDQALLDPRSGWQIEALFDYIKQAEEPLVLNGRIQSDSAQYASRTNLTLRYLILLSEPTTRSKKDLHNIVQSAPGVYGGDRRIFMRKLVPIVSSGSAEPQQFGDDMAYFADNYGGVGFWPSPMVGLPQAPSELAALRASFLSSSPNSEMLCSVVCEQRWPLRIAFEVLLLIGLLSFGLFFAVCQVRRIGRLYLLYLAVGSLPTLIIGALLLRCDPALQQLRNSNTLLLSLIIGLVLISLYLLLKPRVEKP